MGVGFRFLSALEVPALMNSATLDVTFDLLGVTNFERCTGLPLKLCSWSFFGLGFFMSREDIKVMLSEASSWSLESDLFVILMARSFESTSGGSRMETAASSPFRYRDRIAIFFGGAYLHGWTNRSSGWLL